MLNPYLFRSTNSKPQKQQNILTAAGLCCTIVETLTTPGDVVALHVKEGRGISQTRLPRAYFRPLPHESGGKNGAESIHN